MYEPTVLVVEQEKDDFLNESQHDACPPPVKHSLSTGYRPKGPAAVAALGNWGRHGVPDDSEPTDRYAANRLPASFTPMGQKERRSELSSWRWNCSVNQRTWSSQGRSVRRDSCCGWDSRGGFGLVGMCVQRLDRSYHLPPSSISGDIFSSRTNAGGFKPTSVVLEYAPHTWRRLRLAR